jgi:hypothetical protein
MILNSRELSFRPNCLTVAFASLLRMKEFTQKTKYTYIVWHNSPLRELIKLRNLKKRYCATVVEHCCILPPLPSSCFAPHRVLLGYVVTTGSCNSKERPRDLSVSKKQVQLYCHVEVTSNCSVQD